MLPIKIYNRLDPKKDLEFRDVKRHKTVHLGLSDIPSCF